MGTMKIIVDISAMPVETLTITVFAREGRSMAPKLVTKKAAPKKAKAAAKKVKAAAKKAAPAKAKAAVVAKKTSVAPKTSKTVSSRSGLPAATIRALKELKAGKLTRYADADDLFRKLGIKLGKV
jgi:hypothetical protein